MLLKIRNRIEQFVYRKIFARFQDITSRTSMVSFTFDDIPESALFNGARILEENNARGTFYISPGLFGKTTEVGKIISSEDMRKCYAAGHEIGHHTFSHIDYSNFTKREILEDMRNAAKEFNGIETENFSYCFGATSTRSRTFLRNYFKTCRGIESGINRESTDLLNLKSNSIYSKNNNLEALLQTISEVKQAGGWLIFYTHDVTRDPSPFGCTEEIFRTIVKAVKDNEIPILTVKDALARLH